jgi:hypothetical protein
MAVDQNAIYVHPAVVNSNYVWTYQSGASASADAAGGRTGQTAPSLAKPQADNHYTVVDSLFAANRSLTGSGTGARLEYEDIDSSFLELVGTTVSDQPVVLEQDQTKRNYLHRSPSLVRKRAKSASACS